jgi:hypothetical protein
MASLPSVRRREEYAVRLLQVTNTEIATDKPRACVLYRQRRSQSPIGVEVFTRRDSDEIASGRCEAHLLNDLNDRLSRDGSLARVLKSRC